MQTWGFKVKFDDTWLWFMDQSGREPMIFTSPTRATEYIQNVFGKDAKASNFRILLWTATDKKEIENDLSE